MRHLLILAITVMFFPDSCMARDTFRAYLSRAIDNPMGHFLGKFPIVQGFGFAYIVATFLFDKPKATIAARDLPSSDQRYFSDYTVRNFASHFRLDLQHYATKKDYWYAGVSEQERTRCAGIMHHYNLYQFDEFCKMVLKFENAETILQEICTKINTDQQFYNDTYQMQGLQPGEFHTRVYAMAHQIRTEKYIPHLYLGEAEPEDSLPWQPSSVVRIEPYPITPNKQPEQSQKKNHLIGNTSPALANTFKDSAQPYCPSHDDAQTESTEAYVSEYEELHNLLQQHHISDTHIEQRLQAMKDIERQVNYTSQHYSLSSSLETLLQDHEKDPGPYLLCYGNQLQQAIHQECIGILERISQIPLNSALYDHRGVLVEFADTAEIYNQYGYTTKAMRVSDMCWSLLEYANAAAEGAAAGALAVAAHTLENPLQTALCVAFPQYMLAYQVGRVLYEVAEIAHTAYKNPELGTAQWDDYIAPLTTTVKILEDKRVSLRDKIKLGTQIGMQFYAQGKLLGALSTFYDKISSQALAFSKANPAVAPAEYAELPSGYLLKICTKTSQLEEFLNDIPSTDCPASCINNMQKLEYALRIKEFTSIIKVTKHGIQRLIERKFSPEDVKTIYHAPDIIKTQNDGAQAFIKMVGDHKYNVMIYNQHTGSVITALKNIGKKDLIKLEKNYGWT